MEDDRFSGVSQLIARGNTEHILTVWKRFVQPHIVDGESTGRPRLYSCSEHTVHQKQNIRIFPSGSLDHDLFGGKTVPAVDPVEVGIVDAASLK